MHFDLEGRSFGTPTVESAISWREQWLLSALVHVLAALLLLLLPELEFFRELEARRQARLAESGQLLAEQRTLPPPAAVVPDDESFVFVAPRIDQDASEPPRPDAAPSDRDRIAQSPEHSLEPANRLPIAEGNSSRLVESDLPDEPVDPLAPLELEDDRGVEAEGSDLAADTQGVQQEVDRADESGDGGAPPDVPPDAPPASEGPGPGSLTASLFRTPGSGSGADDTARRPDIVSDGLLGQASRALRRTGRRESFHNLEGDTGRFGPHLQFDTKGVEFGPWVRRFTAQVYRNWFWPYRVITDHGHVVLTFTVHKDGSLTDVRVRKPSLPSFNRSAANALNMSNPTVPLPQEYPEDELFVTATFYYNEAPAPLR